VLAALRPAVLVSVARSGSAFTLNGELSAAASTGARSIVSYAWSVTATSGGATMPLITNPDQAIASVPVPAQGTVTIQLVVTDSSGDSDQAEVTLTRYSAGSNSAPPVAEVRRGGGGLDGILLALLGLMLVGRMCHRRMIIAPRPGA